MAVTFQSILDMSEITSLNGADKFLVARGDDTYYTSYQTTYSALSNTLYNNFVENAYKLSIVTNENELADSLKSKAVAGNIGYMFKTRISDLSAAVVTKDGNQTISGIKDFSSSPTVPNVVDSTNQQAVVNYHTLTSWVQSNLSCTNPLFTTVFAGQRCNLSSLFVSRVCPMWNSTTFPTSFTIYCSFYTTVKSNITPVFKVYNTTGTSTKLPTTRYLGTQTINASTASGNKNSNYCKYSCFVSGIKANKIRIDIDNKNANTMISLSIYPWKMPLSPE